MAMSQNDMYQLGEGELIMFDAISMSTIELSERQFQMTTTSSFSLYHRLYDFEEKVYVKTGISMV